MGCIPPSGAGGRPRVSATCGTRSDSPGIACARVKHSPAPLTDVSANEGQQRGGRCRSPPCPRAPRDHPESGGSPRSGGRQRKGAAARGRARGAPGLLTRRIPATRIRLPQAQSTASSMAACPSVTPARRPRAPRTSWGAPARRRSRGAPGIPDPNDTWGCSAPSIALLPRGQSGNAARASQLPPGIPAPRPSEHRASRAAPGSRSRSWPCDSRNAPGLPAQGFPAPPRPPRAAGPIPAGLSPVPARPPLPGLPAPSPVPGARRRRCRAVCAERGRGGAARARRYREAEPEGRGGNVPARRQQPGLGDAGRPAGPAPQHRQHRTRGRTAVCPTPLGCGQRAPGSFSVPPPCSSRRSCRRTLLCCPVTSNLSARPGTQPSACPIPAARSPGSSGCLHRAGRRGAGGGKAP